ncbi:MAG: signal peptidase II [bacterium]
METVRYNDKLFGVLSAYILAGVVFLFDQGSKVLVEVFMYRGQNEAVIETLELLKLTYIKNPGAAWGILPGYQILFVLVALFVTVGCIWFVQNFYWHSIRFPVALLLGGGLGNMIDRIFLAEGVVDFINIGVLGYRWPVFNFADLALTVGVIWLSTLLLTGRIKLDKIGLESL